MKRDSLLKSELERRFRQELEQESKRVLSDSDARVSSEFLERAERYHKLIELLPGRAKPEKLVAVVIFTISLLFVAVLWVWRVNEVAFAADVRAAEIGIRPTPGEISFGGLIEAHGASISGLEWIGGIPGREDQLSRFGAASLVIPGSEVRLEELTIHQTSGLVFRTLGETLTLVVHDTVLSGVISYSPQHQDGQGNPYEFETLRFDRREAGSTPVSLAFTTAKMRPIDQLGVSSVDFLWHSGERSSENPFRSSLLGGEVRIPETEERHHLARGDSLFLAEPSDVQRFELMLSEEKSPARDVAEALGIMLRKDQSTGRGETWLAARFSGTTRRLAAGPEAGEKDLRPTRLEHWSHNKSAALFWAALLFISGVLWKVREVLPL